MNAQQRKEYIKELVMEFCVAGEGDSQARLSLFWTTNPDLYRDYVIACGEQAARFLGVQINKDLIAAALEEDGSESNVEQLTLPGIPVARLSPLVEVAPGDWRRDIDVSQDQQISHSYRMRDKLRQKASYQDRKGREQEVAREAMERLVPGSASMPRGQVIEHWREIGLFDDEPVTTTHQATT